MSAGNTKDKGSNYGSNYSYQLSVLQLLSSISASGGGCCPATNTLLQNTTAKDSTLQSILAALGQGSTFYSNLVIDNNGTGNTYSEVRVWDPVTSTFTTYYYDASGAPVVPIPPLVYVNPQYVLNDIYLQAIAINASAASIDTKSTTIATNTGTTATNTGSIVTNTGTIITNTGTIVTNTGTTASNTGTIVTNTGTIATNTGNTATNTSTTATNTGTTATNTGTIATNTTGVIRTPAMTRVSSSVPVTINANTIRSVSFRNAGSVNATVLGANLLPGETVNFDAGSLKDTLGAITYNANGTDLLIITIA